MPEPILHPADRLLAAIGETAPVCVGLDPVLERLPDGLRPGAGVDDDASVAAAFRSFGLGVLDAVAGIVPCVKPQSACFERYGAAGSAVRDELVAEARARGLAVVLDAKRGDIGISARHYEAAAGAADWLTISPYLGPDTIAPFLEHGRGAFALVRTSNPGSDALQDLPLADGRTVADAVADLVRETGAAHVGAAGFSALGAVVGATKRRDAARLRARMPAQLFLVPGYGAQGGGVDDVLPCFHDDGRGAIVTASRSVIYAEAGGGTWTDAVARAARRLADEIGSAVAARAASLSEL